MRLRLESLKNGGRFIAAIAIKGIGRFIALSWVQVSVTSVVTFCASYVVSPRAAITIGGAVGYAAKELTVTGVYALSSQVRPQLAPADNVNPQARALNQAQAQLHARAALPAEAGNQAQPAYLPALNGRRNAHPAGMRAGRPDNHPGALEPAGSSSQQRRNFIKGKVIL